MWKWDANFTAVPAPPSFVSVSTTQMIMACCWSKVWCRYQEPSRWYWHGASARAASSSPPHQRGAWGKRSGAQPRSSRPSMLQRPAPSRSSRAECLGV